MACNLSPVEDWHFGSIVSYLILTYSMYTYLPVGKFYKSLNPLYYGSGSSDVRHTQIPGFHTQMPVLCGQPATVVGRVLERDR
jgi:hypothetical protein